MTAVRVYVSLIAKIKWMPLVSTDEKDVRQC